MGAAIQNIQLGVTAEGLTSAWLSGGGEDTTNNELSKTKERLLIVEGLLKALKNLRRVIELIETANDANEARSKLMINLKIKEKQADGILGMPLRKLTNLETQSLYKEEKDLNQ